MVELQSMYAPKPREVSFSAPISEGKIWDGGLIKDTLDTLSLPQYMLGQWMAGEKVSPTGKRITPGSYLTRDMSPGLSKAAVSLVADIGLDPINLLWGAGAAVKGLEGIGAVAKGTSAALEPTRIAAWGLLNSWEQIKKIAPVEKVAGWVLSNPHIGRYIQDMGIPLTLENKAARKVTAKVFRDFGALSEWQRDSLNPLLKEWQAQEEATPGLMEAASRYIMAGQEFRDHYLTTPTASLKAMRDGVRQAREAWMAKNVLAPGAKFENVGVQAIDEVAQKFSSVADEVSDRINSIAIRVTPDREGMARRIARTKEAYGQGGYAVNLFSVKGDRDRVMRYLEELRTDPTDFYNRTGGLEAWITTMSSDRKDIRQIAEAAQELLASGDEAAAQDMVSTFLRESVYKDELASIDARMKENAAISEPGIRQSSGAIDWAALTTERKNLSNVFRKALELVHDLPSQLRYQANLAADAELQDRVGVDLLHMFGIPLKDVPAEMAETVELKAKELGVHSINALAKDADKLEHPLAHVSQRPRTTSELYELGPRGTVFGLQPEKGLGPTGHYDIPLGQLSEESAALRESAVSATLKEALAEPSNSNIALVRRLLDRAAKMVHDEDALADAESAIKAFASARKAAANVQDTDFPELWANVVDAVSRLGKDVPWNESPIFKNMSIRGWVSTEAPKGVQASKMAARRSDEALAGYFSREGGAGALVSPEGMPKYVRGYNDKDAAALAAEANTLARARHGLGNMVVADTYAAMPVSPTWGLLSGAILPRQLVSELTLARTRPEGLMKFLGQVYRPWSFGVVALNPGIHVQNAIGNMMIAHWVGELPPWRVDKYLKYAREYMKGLESPEYREFAEKLGGQAAVGQIGELERAARQVGQRSRIAPTSWEKLGDAVGAITNKVSDAYGASEKFFKYAVYRTMREAGHPVDVAIEKGVQAIFDYGDVPYALAALRRSGIIPFPTFTMKSLPVIARTMLNNPQRLTLYGRKLPTAVEQGLGTYGQPKTLPKYVEDRKDTMVSLGKGRYFDIGKYLVTQGVTDTIAMPGSRIRGPVLNVLWMLSTGRDKNGIPIYVETDTPDTKAQKIFNAFMSAGFPIQSRWARDIATGSMTTQSVVSNLLGVAGIRDINTRKLSW